MSKLNSFDLLQSIKDLQNLALEYSLKGSVKFSVDCWKYNHIEELQFSFHCCYVDTPNNFVAVFKSDTLEYVFADVEHYFANIDVIEANKKLEAIKWNIQWSL